MRKNPNIIVTGTPGVGKSRHCEHIASSTGLRHMVVSKVAEERSCLDGRDVELGSWIVDEDKVGVVLFSSLNPQSLFPTSSSARSPPRPGSRAVRPWKTQ
jgi:broad-specificity NMP kinase